MCVGCKTVCNRSRNLIAVFENAQMAVCLVVVGSKDSRVNKLSITALFRSEKHEVCPEKFDRLFTRKP